MVVFPALGFAAWLCRRRFKRAFSKNKESVFGVLDRWRGRKDDVSLDEMKVEDASVEFATTGVVNSASPRKLSTSSNDPGTSAPASPGEAASTSARLYTATPTASAAAVGDGEMVCKDKNILKG